MLSSIQKNEVNQFILRRVGAESLVGSRAMTFGGAGATLAIIFLITQIGVNKAVVVWSLAFAAIAFPSWLALALTYDMWIALKLGIDDLHVFNWLCKLQLWWFLLNGLSTFLSIAFLVYSLHATIGLLFVVVSLLGISLVVAAIFAASHRIIHHMADKSEQYSDNNEA